MRFLFIGISLILQLAWAQAADLPALDLRFRPHVGEDCGQIVISTDLASEILAARNRRDWDPDVETLTEIYNVIYQFLFGLQERDLRPKVLALTSERLHVQFLASSHEPGKDRYLVFIRLPSLVRSPGMSQSQHVSDFLRAEVHAKQGHVYLVSIQPWSMQTLNWVLQPTQRTPSQRLQEFVARQMASRYGFARFGYQVLGVDQIGPHVFETRFRVAIERQESLMSFEGMTLKRAIPDRFENEDRISLQGPDRSNPNAERVWSSSFSIVSVLHDERDLPLSLQELTGDLATPEKSNPFSHDPIF